MAVLQFERCDPVLQQIYDEPDLCLVVCRVYAPWVGHKDGRKVVGWICLTPTGYRYKWEYAVRAYQCRPTKSIYPTYRKRVAEKKRRAA